MVVVSTPSSQSDVGSLARARDGLTKESYHVVSLDELVLPLVFENLLYVLLITRQRTLLLDSNAGGQVVRMLERTGQVTYLRFELIDRGGFADWGGEVVGFLTLRSVVEGASRRSLWWHRVIMKGALGSHSFI